MRCPTCQTEMKPLLNDVFCPNDCDRKPATKPACALPPKGWICSRPDGHEGPCAARCSLTFVSKVVGK